MKISSCVFVVVAWICTCETSFASEINGQHANQNPSHRHHQRRSNNNMIEIPDSNQNSVEIRSKKLFVVKRRRNRRNGPMKKKPTCTPAIYKFNGNKCPQNTKKKMKDRLVNENGQQESNDNSSKNIAHSGNSSSISGDAGFKVAIIALVGVASFGIIFALYQRKSRLETPRLAERLSSVATSEVLTITTSDNISNDNGWPNSDSWERTMNSHTEDEDTHSADENKPSADQDKHTADQDKLSADQDKPSADGDKPCADDEDKQSLSGYMYITP